MNTPIQHTSVSNNQSDLNREQTRAALLSMILVIMFVFLMFAPNYLPSKIMDFLLGVVPAVYMTWYLRKYPESLRDRRGTQFTAKMLVAFLWFVAVATVVAILANIIE